MSASTAPHRRFVPPPPPRTPKAAGTRRLLLDLAARLFIERGYHAVSMNDIAAAADLTKGALYGHFRSKGQLLIEVIRWWRAEREQSPEFAAALADPARALDLMYDRGSSEIRLLEVDAAAAARHDPDIAAGVVELYRERHAWIQDAIADVCDSDIVTWLIFALSLGVGACEAGGTPLPDTDRLRTTLRTALDALNHR